MVPLDGGVPIRGIFGEEGWKTAVCLVHTEYLRAVFRYRPQLSRVEAGGDSHVVDLHAASISQLSAPDREADPAVTLRSQYSQLILTAIVAKLFAGGESLCLF